MSTIRQKDKKTMWVAPDIAMPARWISSDSDALFAAILKLQNVEEARRFFRDLLTEKEIIEFARRWKTARMLARGDLYLDIEAATGMSSTTIARINQWLESGMGGYKLALSRTRHADSPPSRRGLS